MPAIKPNFTCARIRGLFLKSSQGFASTASVTSPTRVADRSDLLCFSHLPWHFVTQRPQHLLCRAARDRRVFYWEEPVWHRDEAALPRRADGSPGMDLEVLKEGSSLWVLRPHLSWGIDGDAGQRILLDEFMASFGVEDFTLWLLHADGSRL